MAKQGKATVLNAEEHGRFLSYLATTRQPLQNRAIYLLGYRLQHIRQQGEQRSVDPNRKSFAEDYFGNRPRDDPKPRQRLGPRSLDIWRGTGTQERFMIDG
jgi:hypothetical protein